MIKLPYTTSYRATVKSEHLYAESPYQLWTLSNADFVTNLREIGKICTFAGMVALIANSVFRFDHTPILSVFTIGSSLGWFVGYRLAQTLEPEAQKMLKFLRDLTEIRKGQLPLSRCDLSPEELQRFRQNAIELLTSTSTNVINVV